MINKTVHFLIIFLFISITLINSHLFDFFGFYEIWAFFHVNWSFEFTKVMYFNILSWFILSLYFFWQLFGWSDKKLMKLYIPKIIFPIIFILLVSTFFSISFPNSFFWNSDKSHSLIMFLNLIWLYILFINSSYNFKKNILFWSAIALVVVILVALMEFINPSFDYWNLWNRLFWTFGHPNYLALYLLLLLPIIIENKININKYIKLLLLILIIVSIFLTKSIIAIFLAIWYLMYFFLKNKDFKYIKIFSFLWVFILVLALILQDFWFSKLDSFISRFYLWETTILIIMDNSKTFFIWNWLSTLDLVFDNFKVTQLYIHENFWFTADRPHNIFLNIFYHIWIFGLLIFIYLVYKLIFKVKTSSFKISLILALIFLFFNFASISSYLLIILLISLIWNENVFVKRKILNYFILLLITSFSVFWAYSSYIKYKTEIQIYDWKIKNHNIIIPNCKNLKIKSAETYFYCWNKYWWKGDKQKAKEFYNLWLKKLPDLWNLDSPYFENPFIRYNPDILHRFFSERHSNINTILERVWIQKELPHSF